MERRNCMRENVKRRKLLSTKKKCNEERTSVSSIQRKYLFQPPKISKEKAEQIPPLLTHSPPKKKNPMQGEAKPHEK